MILNPIEGFETNSNHSEQPNCGLEMKKIEAIINPLKFGDVKDALNKLGVKGMTVTNVNGYGRQRGHTEIYRGAEYKVEFIPKLKMEIIIQNDMLPQVIDTLIKAANTQKIGDGKIFVSTVEDVIRIRTGENGNLAI